MYKLLLSLFLLTVFSGSANASAISKLNEVNAEWKNNSDGKQLVSSKAITGNETFTDWIATHLMLVEQTLRNRPVENLNIYQKENRLRLLNVLNVYWHQKVFPVNDYLSYKNPVFIDRIGTHCAVGYLMQQSGAEALACAIDADNKFVFVKDIKTKGVTEWAFENGFTIDELAWIQPGYPVTFTVGDLDGGLNGTVKALVVDPTTQILYAGGSFTASTVGAYCNGVAVYMNGIAGFDWLGLGTGVNGTVNTMLVHNNKLYVGGDFSTAGSVSALNVAAFDLNTQQWESVGNLDSSVNSLAMYNNELYAGGKFTGLVSKWTGSQWQDITQGFISGAGVRTLEVWNNTLIIGGSFDLATGAYRENVATYDGSYMGSLGFGTVTPVNDFEVFHDTIYAACDVADGNDTCAIARFSNFDWEIVLKPFSAMISNFVGSSVNHLLVAEDRLFCSGNFHCASGMIYGSRMMEFQIDASGDPNCIPLLSMDSTVLTMISYANVITFGGEFIGTNLNHVGELFNVISSISNPGYKTSNAINVFPNPVLDRMNVQFKEYSKHNACYLKVLDAIGREVYTQKIIQQITSMDLQSISKGVYLVQVVNGEGEMLDSEKIIVQ